MPFIIGTAGHVDHGKTSLVKALTGQDTDRLEAEKERGISIELGFAHFDLPDGSRAGVVDVPGHERFIRTMLAGAHGMDLVLFTVAADDGVMPQTLEHLDILHLLGIRRAIFVVTKADLATAARIAEVETEIEGLVRGTLLEGSTTVPFSSATGEGLDRLRAEIMTALGSMDRTPPPGYFRLPVDRVFVLQGHGVIATGTALQGEVSVGDRVRCLPGGQILRVRALQVHGEPLTTATWGQRIALNVSGAQRPAIERGHVLCDERLTAVTNRFDATCEIRPSAPPVKSHQRVRVHLGTAERQAKLVVLGSDERVESGTSAFCQIVLSAPLPALRGDRFILRDETAQRTLGGGVVIHPASRPHRRDDPSLAAKLETLRTGDVASVAELLLDERDEFASTSAALGELLNLESEVIARQLRASSLKVVSLEGDAVFTTERRWCSLEAEVTAALAQFHATHPLEYGRDMEGLREGLGQDVAPRLFRAFVESLAAEGRIVREGSLVRLPGHRIALSGEEQAAAERVRHLLASRPLAPPDLAQLVQETGIERVRLGQVIRVLERERSVVRVAPDMYMLRESVDQVVRVLRDEWTDVDDITPAMFRDRFHTTRKYAIPLLEYLDQTGVTIRNGDRRRLRGGRATVP